MKKITTVLCCLLLLAQSAHAQQQKEDPIIQKISQAAASMKTMQCDFVQTKHLKLLNDDMVAQGKMWYQQPDKLRWEYTSPYAYLFLLNDDKVQLKNRQRNDVIDVKQNKLFREIARMMMSSVVGDCLTDSKDFKTTIATVGHEWVATLVPQRKDMKQMFQKLLLHFDQKKATVCRVEFIERNGDKTVIDLKNVKTNETIGAQQFTVR